LFQAEMFGRYEFHYSIVKLFALPDSLATMNLTYSDW
jgi:hypothetical protein